jgi:hypothetical protein
VDAAVPAIPKTVLSVDSGSSAQPPHASANPALKPINKTARADATM